MHVSGLEGGTRLRRRTVGLTLLIHCRRAPAAEFLIDELPQPVEVGAGCGTRINDWIDLPTLGQENQRSRLGELMSCSR